MMTQDKNKMTAHLIMGKATEEEQRYLQEQCSPEELTEIMNADDLAKRYRLYDGIDEEEAYNKVIDLLAEKPKRRTRYLTLWRVAAVLLVLFAGGVYWWYRDYTKVTPPEISQEILAAIETSNHQGKNDAHQETITTSADFTKTSKGTFSDEIIQDLLNLSGSDKQSASSTEGQQYELSTTYHDKEFWMTLDDGTLVHMNADSRIIYPEKFNRSSREVILQGEAYFMVAKDKSRPFIVHTQQGDVKVYGTEFDINTRARDNSSKKRDCTSVVLVKGSVGVTPSEGKEYMLTPGQQIIIKDHSNSPYISKADLRPYVAWNTKKFDFEDYPLEGLMEIIYRWYHLDYVINDPSITNTLVSGSISRYDTIEPLLHAISKITGYEVQIKDNTIYINY